MALMQITVIPMGTAKPGVGEYIADIERFLGQAGVDHSLHDMGTVIHGKSEKLLALAHQIHQLPFSRGAERVVTQITLDERLDKDPGIGEKVLSVIKQAGGPQR
ncbi:MAG: MTH1187 family thiamine-binding protein [Desulfobulbaceae bacterium]|nr:MTH1187 family thiamine-binding protein [Desulfobulbaceae bacterium]MDY0349975.1 MTH1187 family thiamine-binding protein [Desulfobulbaceae bacterium]